MLSSPLLVLLVIPALVALVVLAQAADVPGLTPNQLFVIEVLKLVIPVLTGALSIAAAYLAYLKSREVKQEVGALNDKHQELTRQINGRMSELTAAVDRAARAEGKLEGVTEVAPTLAPPPPAVQVVIDPDAKPGGKRKLDPPVPPTTPAPDHDPSTHQGTR